MSNHSVNYFATNWWAWRLLGADELNANNLHSYRYWRAVVLNVIVTAAFPPMLGMVLFSFEQPLDNLMNFNLTLTSLATSAKFIIYVRQLQKVIQIEQILAELDSHVNTEEQRECHGRMDRVLRTILIFYKSVYALIGINANVSFMFRTQRSLPFPAWFPGNWHDSLPIYLVAVFHQILAISMQIMQNFVDDVFPPLMLVLIAGQCEMLIMRISSIGYDRCDQRTNEWKLISCIQDQHRIYKMHKLAMEIISWSLLVQFVVISIDVGAALCAYFLYVKDLQDRVYYISFIIALAMEIFPVCYYGTLVKYGFESLHSAVYRSNWVDQSLSYRRNAIIIAERTQRWPKQLAGNFIPIALTTFLANCKAAYSFCTLIADTRSDN